VVIVVNVQDTSDVKNAPEKKKVRRPGFTQGGCLMFRI